MRINSQDHTIKKYYIQKYRFLVGEYQEVKAGSHARYSETDFPGADMAEKQ